MTSSLYLESPKPWKMGTRWYKHRFLTGSCPLFQSTNWRVQVDLWGSIPSFHGPVAPVQAQRHGQAQPTVHCMIRPRHSAAPRTSSSSLHTVGVPQVRRVGRCVGACRSCVLRRSDGVPPVKTQSGKRYGQPHSHTHTHQARKAHESTPTLFKFPGFHSFSIKFKSPHLTPGVRRKGVQQPLRQATPPNEVVEGDARGIPAVLVPQCLDQLLGGETGQERREGERRRYVPGPDFTYIKKMGHDHHDLEKKGLAA